MANDLPLKLDRIAIEEVGLNPEKLALAIHRQLALTAGAVPVYAIARALDIEDIREEALVNLEGMLLTTPERSNGSILVNSRSSPERRRFSVGHELGHFLISTHQSVFVDGFKCSAKDMIEIGRADNQNLRQEAEANRFAISLLAPAHLLKRHLSRSPDLRHVLATAHELEISKEAAARRYVELHQEDLAVVFSLNGRMLYSSQGREFPRLMLRKGDLLPGNIHQIEMGHITHMDQVTASDWLLKTHRIELFAEGGDEPDEDDVYDRLCRR